MKLEKARHMAMKMMRDHGLKDYTFKWDRAVRRFGCHNGRMKTISLSRPLTEHETKEQRVINTILHEIAHALDHKKRGYSNHDKHWKKVAKSIGCTGERCTSNSSIDLSRVMKWIGECPKCNKRFHRARRTNIACGPCCKKYNNNKYTPEYKIEWELNKKVVRYEY
tara:strand:+ start:130 stop:627 length:498 start_codon:yes stop_codon:yes gene_type:complete